MTIIANYIPLEDPAGGPNFTGFDDTSCYEIHIDNDGDSEDDITYQFRFKTQIANPDTFLYNAGPIALARRSELERPQTYSVARRHGPGRRSLGTNIPTPPENIGPRSTPTYDALAAAAVAHSDERHQGVRRPARRSVLRRPRLDLRPGGLRPFNSLHAIPLANAAGSGRVRQLQHAHDRDPDSEDADA